MDEVALEEFQNNAPIIGVEELAEMLRFEMLSDETREKANSIWIVGSFVTPDKDIDTGESHSDLDVFVVLPNWELPIAGTALAMMAPQSDTLARYEQYPEKYNWSSKDTPRWKWDCSAEEAWERIPEHAQKTLVQSTERYFFATDDDIEENRQRSYELNIANQQQLEHAVKDIPALEIWRDGRETDGESAVN